MRFLFWLALIGLVYFALRSKWKAFQRNARREVPPASQPGTEQTSNSTLVSEGEKMVVCSHCAVYFPASEALRHTHAGQELIFCSALHQQQHAAKQSAQDSAP
jgi:uncharacterized protein